MENSMEHRIILRERKNLDITGVIEVESFDEGEIVLKTRENTLKIQGNGLKIGTLSVDGGALKVEGEVEAILYEDGKVEKSGIFRRFFA